MARISVASMPVEKLVSLLTSANTAQNMSVRIMGPDQIALGVDPLNPTLAIDLDAEKVVPFRNVQLPSTQQKSVAPDNSTTQRIFEDRTPRSTRNTGNHWVEVKGRRVDCGSLREVLSEGLRALESIRPGMLDKLTLVQPRSKRIVARDRNALFKKAHLADDFAEPLMEGWWFGTNNSSPETKAWLERACSYAGLEWGKDFRTSI